MEDFYDYVFYSCAEPMFRGFVCSLIFLTLFGICWLIGSTKGDTQHVHVKRILDFQNCSEFLDLYQVYTRDFAINICLNNGTIEIKHRNSSAYVMLYPQWNKCAHEKLAKGIEDSIKFLL